MVFTILSHADVYILGVFIEKPCDKKLERNVVYILIIKSTHATSIDFKTLKQTMALYIMTPLTPFRCQQKYCVKMFNCFKFSA